MKAIVTGGAGFIGSHLVDHLVTLGIQVLVLDNMASGHLRHLHPLASIQYVDIGSNEAMQHIVGYKPNVVFHLAAQTDVQKSLVDPQYDADVNIGGTINVLEACRKANVRKMIFASSSAVYGNVLKRKVSEKEKIAPISYYGSSKAASEAYIRLYHQLYGIPYTILRFSNVFGPRQTAKGEGGVIAVFLKHIHENKTLFVHGDGNQTRDFIYVKDVVRALMAAIVRGDQEIYHVSTSRKTSINQLVAMLTRIHGGSLEILHTTSNIGDIKHSCLSNRKISRQLLWQPSVELTAGLSDTYAFTKREFDSQGGVSVEASRD
ncbi:NAD-dependent epimerase/dehydratase family protein [Cohnella terricola]|uniref:NAD-dependent epimerase/dehydratase family protein n=1 Tax=Cohnella terricola TaxID=1289167 RepID=A0A559JQJ9_9BACL|nr:NAD-dependent epimerase/dehydratase family protein [Cohnella terricola]TVY02155.1 NAD-dependent epimerase/dehydratase family protein [Cohnella terricola]